jgi:DNA primase
MGSKDDFETLVIGDREVRITHPEKPYFSKEARISKMDLVRYYLAVAEGALRVLQTGP